MVNIASLPRKIDVALASKLYSMGFTVIPIKLLKDDEKWLKKPLIEKWSEYGIIKNQSIVEVLQFPWNNANGVAILTGIKLRDSNYYIGALDFDEPEAYEKVKDIIPKTYIERTPRGGIHVLFLCKKQPKLISYKRKGQRGEVFSVLGISPNGKPKLCTIYPSENYEILNPAPIARIDNLNALANKIAFELGILEIEKPKEKKKIPQKVLDMWFKRIKPHLNIAKEYQNYYAVHCPFHPPDEHPSFIIYKNTYLAIDFHDGKKYTLKELARALGIDLLDGTKLGTAEVEGKTINFIKIGDNYDAIIEEIAKTPEIKQLIALIEDDPNTHVSTKAYLLASAISSVITFVRVIYGEETKLWYFDGYILCPRAEDLINMIVRRILVPYSAVTTNVVNETIRNVMAFAPIEIPRGALDPYRYLPFRNVALDLITLEPISYEELAKRKAFFTTQLKYDLDIELLNKIKENIISPENISPEFHSFLTRFYDTMNLEKIQLALGYILCPYQTKKPIVLIIGPPDTGKSTLKEIIQYVLENFAVSMSLDDIVKDFGLAPLVGKRVNISSEKPSLAVNTEKIKRMTGGETLVVNQKYKPQFEAIINPVFIHLMNDPPKFSHIDDALVGRVIIIRTTNPLTSDEKDSMFIEKMKANGHKIIHYLIWCYKKLKDNNFIIPQDVDDVYDTLLSGRSNVKRFLDEVVEFEPRTEIKGTELYDIYVKWCAINAENAVGLKTFYEDIVYYAAGKVVRKEKQRATYFIGLRPKEKYIEEEPKTPEEAIIRIIKRLDEGNGAHIADIYREFKTWAKEHNIPDDIFDKIKNLLEERGEIIDIGNSRYKIV